ncbi:MAG: sulfatase-like hydrolase/transferase [Acidobacteriota bacterium]|nr:sulfatase-like hydrolase/transferase [Acidobacteriota bacterium]
MRLWMVVCLSLLVACGPDSSNKPPEKAVPAAVLLVTLDTSRADYFFPSKTAEETPAFAALAQSGRLFTQAYATAPMTLPSHASMMTGMYPSEHGIHENARYLPPDKPLLAQQLHEAGWFTAAAVSAYPLAAEFGLNRGFDRYDDSLPEGAPERRADVTTASALQLLDAARQEPLFLWVHYFDPHHPYQAPPEYIQKFPDDAYMAEIAYTDANLGRVVEHFRQTIGNRPHLIMVVGDHGESLGDHGEAQHGNLLYQGVMRVPMVIAGTGIEPGREDRPVSVRDVAPTVLAFADLEKNHGLLRPDNEVVLGEAMKPFLQYGWSPQVMAVSDGLKVIRSTSMEVYDLTTDQTESQNLVETRKPSPKILKALFNYPVPGADQATQNMTQEQMEQLSSLGYSASVGVPGQRDHMPAPAAMTHLFDLLDRGSDQFVRGNYDTALKTFNLILAEDPDNLMVHVRMAVANSLLGNKQAALDHFRKAGKLSEDSVDLHHYLGMHYMRFGEWERAAQRFTHVLERLPYKRAALENLGKIRERQKRPDEALSLFQRALAIKEDPDLRLRCGYLYMAKRETDRAIDDFETASQLMGNDFPANLDLGVCYLDAGRRREAATVLERVPASDPRYPMALFKRAQVSVLLQEPDAAGWIERARTHADRFTAPLIANERLFQGY